VQGFASLAFKSTKSILFTPGQNTAYVLFVLHEKRKVSPNLSLAILIRDPLIACFRKVDIMGLNLSHSPRFSLVTD
jgi:hypothetical protein